MDLNDVAWSALKALQADFEGHDVRLYRFGVENPQTDPVSLCARGAAESNRVHLAIADAFNQSLVFDVLDLLFELIGRVVPAYMDNAVAILTLRTDTVEHAIDNVGVGVEELRVRRRVLRQLNHTARPVSHAPEYRADVLDDLVGIGARRDNGVQGEARLFATIAVCNHAVAVAGDGVQLADVDVRRLDVLAQAITLVEHDVAQNPRRVVRVRNLERAVPGANIGPGLSVVVAWHLNVQAVDIVGSAWNLTELGGVDLHTEHHRVRVRQLAVLELVVGIEVGVVRKVRAFRILRDANHANLVVGRRLRQRDQMLTLVLRTNLVVDRDNRVSRARHVHRQEWAVAHGHQELVFDLRTAHVTSR